MTTTSDLDLVGTFKAALRAQGHKGQITTTTGERENEWVVKLTQPNSATSDESTPVIDLSDTGIVILEAETKMHRRNKVTAFTIAPAEAYDDELPGTVHDDPDEETTIVTVDGVTIDATTHAEVEDELPVITNVDDEEAPEDDDEEIEVDDVDEDDEVVPVLPPQEAEKAATKQDSAPVNKDDPEAVAAKVAELLEEKRVHADDKVMQRTIRRKLRALGYYLSRLA